MPFSILYHGGRAALFELRTDVINNPQHNETLLIPKIQSTNMATLTLEVSRKMGVLES